MKLRVTQKDVADKANVSHVTVSLALRGHHSIPRHTQERIKRIALELGYAPDPILAGLTAYRLSRRPTAYQSNIGWINGWPVPKEMYRNDIVEYYAASTERARELGYKLEEICLADINYDVKRLEDILAARGISGLLLPPARHAGTELHLDFSSYSVMRFGYTYRHPDLNTVTNAQFRSALMAVQKLTLLGYRRIGIFLDHDTDERANWNFSGGFLAGQYALSGNAHGYPLPFYCASEEIDRLSTWIKRTHVDAVIGLRSWSMIQEARMDIGYADLSLNSDEKHVSGMYQNCYRIGVAAVDFLAGMLTRGETGIPATPTHLLIESVWYPGQTAVEQTRSVKSPKVQLKRPE